MLTAPRAGPVLALSLIVAIVVAACGGLGIAPSGPQQKVTLRLDFLPAGTHAAFFLALEKGYYSKQGLDLEILDGRGSGVTVQAIGNAQDTFGYAAVSAVAAGVAGGAPLRSVAMLTSKQSFGVFFDANSSIQRLQDLYGKSVLVVAGAPDGFTLTATFAANGLDISKVTLRNVDPSAKFSLYASGTGDAIALTSPYQALFQAQRPSRSFLFAEHGLNLQDYSLIAHTDTIKNHPDWVTKFVSATQQGYQDAIADPQAAAKAVVKYRDQVPLDTAFQQWKFETEFIWSKRTQGKPIGCASDDDWKDTLAVLQKFASLPGDISDRSRFYTNQFIPNCK